MVKSKVNSLKKPSQPVKPVVQPPLPSPPKPAKEVKPKKDKKPKKDSSKKAVHPLGAPIAEIELNQVGLNNYLPRPNVNPLTTFEIDEINRHAHEAPNPCYKPQRIRLPPPSYYSRLFFVHLFFFCLKHFYFLDSTPTAHCI